MAINLFFILIFRGRSWSADRVHTDIGSGSWEWTGKGSGRRRAGRQAGGRKQLSVRPERNNPEFRSNRKPR